MREFLSMKQIYLQPLLAIIFALGIAPQASATIIWAWSNVGCRPGARHLYHRW